MEIRLDGIAGPYQGQTEQLAAGEHLVGRAAGCALLLEDDAEVSANHAWLLVREAAVVLVDQDSRNGTHLNGVRLLVPTVLADGDRIRFGSSEFQVTLGRELTAAGPGEQVLDGETPSEEAVGPGPRLQILNGPRSGEVVELAEAVEIVIGRGRTADLVIQDPFASREHAVVVWRTGQVAVRDNRSANKLQVNDQTVPAAMLQDGDVLQIGRTRIRFVAAGVAVPPVTAEEQSNAGVEPTSGPEESYDDQPADEEASGSVGRFGPYLLRSELGRGGMGRVFEAEREGGPPVALKLLRTRGVDDRRKRQRRRRFEREAAVLQRIQHPNVVGYLDSGVGGGLPYLVMDLLRGPDLAAELKRGGRLEYNEIERIMFQLCSAVAAVHDSGVVHRDIKPANVILHGPHRTVKLADFGIARPLDEGDLEGDEEALTAARRDREITNEGRHPGTPFYMSPEQVAGLPLDMRSDIWALGVVIYQLVSGRRPFEGRKAGEVMRAVETACPQPLPDSVPPYVRSVVYRSLLKPPHWRYATAKELMEALHERRVEQPVPVGASGPETPPLRRCPHCGVDVRSGRSDCPRCRTDLTQFINGVMVTAELAGREYTCCGACGAAVGRTATVCERCGKEFTGPRSAAAGLRDENLSRDEEEALANALLTLTECPYCSSQVDAERPQCLRCGLNLRAALVGRIQISGAARQRQAHCGNCGVLLRDPSTVLCAKCGLNFVTGQLRGGRPWHRKPPRRRRR